MRLPGIIAREGVLLLDSGCVTARTMSPSSSVSATLWMA
jgi:hypothetical protein